MAESFLDRFHYESAVAGCGYHVSLFSTTGSRTTNEDFVCFRAPPEERLASRGVMLVLADGMSGGEGGREAAEIFCRSVCDFYYGLPDTLSLEKAMVSAIETANRWIFSIGQRDSQLTNMAATFCIMVLASGECHVFSAGDTRAYLSREGSTTLLTEDHTSMGLYGGVVNRAAGFSDDIKTAHTKSVLCTGDCLFLCSDGFYRHLGNRRLGQFLETLQAGRGREKNPLEHADDLAFDDNASVAAVHVDRLMTGNPEFLAKMVCALPLLPAPACGSMIDGHVLEKKVLSSGHSDFFLVSRPDGEKGRMLMKIPRPSLQDGNIRHAFLVEWWLSRNFRSPWTPDFHTSEIKHQSQLYILMDFHEGETLEKKISRGSLRLEEALDIAENIARALYDIHRAGIYHRDLKPENILVGHKNGIRIMDFGFSYVSGLGNLNGSRHLGTPAYLAPETLENGGIDARSDIYSFGVTLYRMLGYGELPFGIGGPVSLKKRRRDIPDWIDEMVAKMLSRNPADRFQDAYEVCFTIQKNRMLDPIQPMAAGQPPLAFPEIVWWRILSLVLVCIILFLLETG